MGTRLREPDGSSKETRPPPLFILMKCPNCGREPAIVFPLIRVHHKSVEDAPLGARSLVTSRAGKTPTGVRGHPANRDRGAPFAAIRETCWG
jgi:hypothetical protein